MIVRPLAAIDLSVTTMFCAMYESRPEVGSSRNINIGLVRTCNIDYSCDKSCRVVSSRVEFGLIVRSATGAVVKINSQSKSPYNVNIYIFIFANKRQKPKSKKEKTENVQITTTHGFR